MNTTYMNTEIDKVSVRIAQDLHRLADRARMAEGRLDCANVRWKLAQLGSRKLNWLAGRNDVDNATEELDQATEDLFNRLRDLEDHY